MIILISLISCNQRHTTSPLCGARVVFMRFVEYEIINLISLMPIYFLLIKIIVHSHGLRPCRSGKPRQGIIPCTLSASPADGRKGREPPAFLSASIYPRHYVKCCPTAMRSAYCHLTSFPLHQTHSPAYTYPIPSSRSSSSFVSISSNRSKAVEPSPNSIVSR